MRLRKMHWFGIIAAVIVLSVGLIFFYKDSAMLFFLIGIAMGILVLPFIIGLSLENSRDLKMNDMFLEFSRNLAESVAAGTPVSRGIINMKKKNYGVLSPHIWKLANQIELGIPVDKALSTFSNDVGSSTVERAIELIRQADRAGGEIEYILESTAKSISEIEKLKKERKSAAYNMVVQGYIIFFIFIGIILVMEFKIIPLTSGIGDFGGFTGRVQDFERQTEDAANGNFDPQQFTKPFLYLLLTQGFFVGLVIGKLTGGNLKSGVKHSFILMITAFLVSSGARLFLVPAAG